MEKLELEKQKVLKLLERRGAQIKKLMDYKNDPESYRIGMKRNGAIYLSKKAARLKS